MPSRIMSDRFTNLLESHPPVSMFDEDIREQIIQNSPEVFDEPCSLEVINAGDKEGPLWIRMYGPIAPWGRYVNAESLMETLDDVSEDRELIFRVKSPGGIASEGLALYNVIAQWGGNVTMRADGVVASAAALMYMAGDSRLVPKTAGAMIMFHRVWSYFFFAANAKKIRSYMDDVLPVMDAYDGEISDIIESADGVDSKKADEILDRDTYLRGKEAIKLGIATGTFDKKDKSKTGTKPGSDDDNSASNSGKNLVSNSGYPQKFFQNMFR